MTGSPGDGGQSLTGPRPSVGNTTCPSCGGVAVSALPFCPSCGKRLRSSAPGPACPRCGTGSQEGTKYCPACGLDLTKPDVAPATGGQSGFALALLDESGNPLGRYPLRNGETTIGRDGADLEFPDDAFLSPLHVKITAHEGAITARDLGSRNGTWMFVGEPHRLVDGERVLVGSQVLEYRRLGYPGPQPPERDATRRMGSLVPSADIACLVQLRADGSDRDTMHLSPGRNLRLGRENGDWTFPFDPSMSGSHAEIRSEDADFVLTDLRSRNGVAISVRGAVTLQEGTRLLVGDEMFRLETS